jgi:FkbM family methyltransferase
MGALYARTRDLFFIQVGANVGKNTGSGDPIWEYVRPCNWSGAVVEPALDTFTNLKINYQDLIDADRVFAFNLGVSNKHGYTKMLGRGEAASLSGEMSESLNQFGDDNSLVVEVVTIAEIWDKLKSRIPSSGVDILVLDVEGNEANILALEEFPHPRPTRILFEIAHLNLDTKDKIDEKLRSQGYRQSADLVHRDSHAITHNLPAQDRLYELVM